jgi:hypothetical protein
VGELQHCMGGEVSKYVNWAMLLVIVQKCLGLLLVALIERHLSV